MSRSFIREPLIFLLLLASCLAIPAKFQAFGDGSVLQVNASKLRETLPYIKQIIISPTSNVTLNITNYSSNIAFYIVQIHSHLNAVTLSYDEQYNTSVFGSNIGLYTKPNLKTITQMFLKNEEANPVKAMLVIMSYNHKAPIPGGCNMEFETEIAPYGKVLTLDTMIVVDVQPASVPLISNATICEKNPVSVEMYQVYLPEQDRSADTYFTYIRQMLTVNDIKENGQQITSSVLSNPMRRIFNAYTGTGSIYVAVATYGNDSAAYVPALSYGCSPVADPESCQVLNDSYSKFICACCFFIGLSSVMVGHKCHTLDMTISVFFTGTVISYIAAGQSITLAWVIGLTLAVAYGIAQYSLAMVKLLFALTLGLFFACVAYFRFPESFVLTQTNGIFWSLFATIAISVCIMKLLLFTFTRGLITCAIIGSFMVILPFDYLAGSALKYIIINIVRRCTVSDFKFAIIQPPVQAKDITLIVFWTLLAIWRCLRGSYSVPTCRIPGSKTEETAPLIGESNVPNTPGMSFRSSYSNRESRPYRSFHRYHS